MGLGLNRHEAGRSGSRSRPRVCLDGEAAPFMGVVSYVATKLAALLISCDVTARLAVGGVMTALAAWWESRVVLGTALDQAAFDALSGLRDFARYATPFLPLVAQGRASSSTGLTSTPTVTFGAALPARVTLSISPPVSSSAIT